MTSDLLAAAEAAVTSLKVPTKASGVYPAIHAAAYAINWPNGSEALGAVFQVIADRCGVKYGSQYMPKIIMAKHLDGTLQGLLQQKQT